MQDQVKKPYRHQDWPALYYNEAGKTLRVHNEEAATAAKKDGWQDKAFPVAEVVPEKDQITALTARVEKLEGLVDSLVKAAIDKKKN